MNDQTLNAPQEAAPQDAASSRRSALRTLGKLGLGAALIGAGSFLRPRVAFAQSAPTAAEILNFALTLEYLERSFYRQGVSTGVVGGDSAVFELIRDHEEAHVEYLADVIEQTTDADPVMFEDGDFDFTAGGMFDPFNNYDQFLLLAQGFEDTGVRAYKGQAANIVGSDYLTPALQIHSLEARHAAEVRRIRARRGANVSPWIVLGSVPDSSPIAAVYGPSIDDDDGNNAGFPAEENLTQAGVDVTFDGRYTDAQASAAFDEPLDMTTVLAIAGPFMQMEPPTVTLDFSNDFGVLNYAYALEQLEAAFYANALDNLDSYSSETQSVLTDLAAHEDIHRQTLLGALGDNAIGQLTPNFGDLDFGDEASVLGTAQVLEDVGVSAYNGAARLIDESAFLAAAGSIVSVEARHAAAIRDLTGPMDNYFGGTYPLDGEYVIGDGALDEARSPEEVLTLAGGFIENEIVTQGLDS